MALGGSHSRAVTACVFEQSPGNVTPKVNSSGTDLIQNQSKASSSPSFIIHSNINLDNNYRDYNASELGITF